MQVIIITEIKISKVTQEIFVKRVKFTSMKKVIMFLLLAVITVGVTSCNSLENKAKEQLKETIGDVMKNPDTFKMRNEKTIISNDSLFVMTFSGIGENSYGGHSNQKYEYVFIKKNPKDEDEITYMEYLGEANDKTSVSGMFKRLKKHESDAEERHMADIFINEGKTEEDAIAMQTYMQALIKCLISGREVEY